MAGSESYGFVEEEEFGPAAAGHHQAPPILVLAATDEPGLARPARREQRSGCGIV
jgi:hypothetical protein